MENRYFLNVDSGSCEYGFIYLQRDGSLIDEIGGGAPSGAGPSQLIPISEVTYNRLAEEKGSGVVASPESYPTKLYRSLIPDELYDVTDSLGQTTRVWYRGFHYDEDWHEDALILWRDGDPLNLVQWPACELARAQLVTAIM